MSRSVILHLYSLHIKLYFVKCLSAIVYVLTLSHNSKYPSLSHHTINTLHIPLFTLRKHVVCCLLRLLLIVYPCLKVFPELLTILLFTLCLRVHFFLGSHMRLCEFVVYTFLVERCALMFFSLIFFFYFVSYYYVFHCGTQHSYILYCVICKWNTQTHTYRQRTLLLYSRTLRILPIFSASFMRYINAV